MGYSSSRDPCSATAPSAPPVACPFHDGPETLDLLLAELRQADSAAVDCALELRHAATVQTDADHCLHLLFALRRLLDGRQHLAFYRVRCWMRRLLVAELRPDRLTNWQPCPLPLDCARYDELVNRCLATLADEVGNWPPTAELRLRFVSASASIS